MSDPTLKLVFLLVTGLSRSLFGRTRTLLLWYEKTCFSTLYHLFSFVSNVMCICSVGFSSVMKTWKPCKCTVRSFDSVPLQPPRAAHPQVKFSCVDSEPMVVDKVPFDKYELEPSPLTQYILERKSPHSCWQVLHISIFKHSYTHWSGYI